MGEWNDGNICNIVRMLHCFHLASGLKINLQKIKLLGIDVPMDRMEEVVEQIRFLIMKTLFSYLGIP